MKRLSLYIMAGLFMMTTSSCGMFDDMFEMLDEILESYEERLSLSDEEMEEYLRGEWILNKVGSSMSTNNEYHIEEVVENPDMVSSISSIEIDGSTFRFNFKQSTKFERVFWTEGVEHVQIEELWFDSYTATSGSTTLYLGFDDNVETFTLWDSTNNGFDEYDIELFGRDLLGNGKFNFEITRMVLSVYGLTDAYYEFIRAE